MPLTLDQAVLGEPVTVLSADGPVPVVRRLAELGLRRGARVTCLGPTSGGGRVVAVAGGRLAVGAPLLRSLVVEPVTA